MSLYSGTAQTRIVAINLDVDVANIATAKIATTDFTGPIKIAGVTVLPTAAELNFVNGVTSAIQTQLDANAATATSDALVFAMLFGEA